jgi:hypothetical protein
MTPRPVPTSQADLGVSRGLSRVIGSGPNPVGDCSKIGSGPNPGRIECLRQTFREQPGDIVQRYQRRTVRLAAQVASVARALAGRAGARVLAAVGVVASRQTSLRALLQLPLPSRSVPRVIGVDDFALRKRQP